MSDTRDEHKDFFLFLQERNRSSALESALAESRGLADQLAAALSLAHDVIGGYRELTPENLLQIRGALTAFRASQESPLPQEGK